MKTAYWKQRFGGQLPPPAIGTVPQEIGEGESKYVRCVLDAYEERLTCTLRDVGELDNYPDQKKDLQRHRERFFDAEAFMHTYRDQTPPGTTEDFTTQIFDAVEPTLSQPHEDGVHRLSAVLTVAGNSNPTNILAEQAKPKVKQGVCHQLANAGNIKWKTK